MEIQYNREYKKRKHLDIKKVTIYLVGFSNWEFEDEKAEYVYSKVKQAIDGNEHFIALYTFESTLESDIIINMNKVTDINIEYE